MECCKRECEIVGRDSGDLELTSLFRLNFDGGDLDQGEIGGGTEQVIDQIGQYADVGLDHAAFLFWVAVTMGGWKQSIDLQRK